MTWIQTGESNPYRYRKANLANSALACNLNGNLVAKGPLLTFLIAIYYASPAIDISNRIFFNSYRNWQYFNHNFLRLKTFNSQNQLYELSPEIQQKLKVHFNRHNNFMVRKLFTLIAILLSCDVCLHCVYFPFTCAALSCKHRLNKIAIITQDEFAEKQNLNPDNAFVPLLQLNLK